LHCIHLGHSFKIYILIHKKRKKNKNKNGVGKYNKIKKIYLKFYFYLQFNIKKLIYKIISIFY